MKRFFRKMGMKRFLANSKGSSIVELLVVMTIIGILGAIAAPNFSKWSLARQVDGESKKLSLELMLARISAIKNNNNVVVRFNNPAANQYTVHSDTNSDNVVDAGETLKTVPLNPRIQFGFFGGGILDPDGSPVTSSIFLAGGGTNTLTFNPRGQASASGSLYLIPASEAGLSNQLLRGISIVQATGSVDYWEYVDGPTPVWQ